MVLGLFIFASTYLPNYSSVYGTLLKHVTTDAINHTLDSELKPFAKSAAVSKLMFIGKKQLEGPNHVEMRSGK